MKSIVTGAACVGLAVLSGSVPLLAQSRDNSERQLTCGNNSYNNDRPRHCEMREQTLPSIGRLSIDAAQNGGVTVKGWSRGDVLVRARVEAQSEDAGGAASMASRVLIDGSGGQVRAIGPEARNDSWWSVSYEIFVPQATELTIKANNGGINVSDVRGRLAIEGVNGGVRLKRVAGEIIGKTVNGGIDIELAGSAADARQMELSTVNGGVTVTVPANYSARVQTETGMGRVESDFPLPMDAGRSRPRKMDFMIGAGGPPIHITTGNGGIRLKRAESQ
jgi:hypothetical protein